MDDNGDLIPTVDRLVEQGMIEKRDSILILTGKGREDAFLRWRGIQNDIKVLLSLWLKERYDKLT